MVVNMEKGLVQKVQENIPKGVGTGEGEGSPST